jgi:hypothetical protein
VQTQLSRRFALLTESELIQADPFLRPYWRYERVLELTSHVPPKRCNRFDDKWISEYRAFLLKINKSPNLQQRLLVANPGLYYAHKILDKQSIEPETAVALEARLLAGVPPKDIAKALKTFTATVIWYEKLFFNVTSRLTHSDWIVKNVLLPAYEELDSSDEAEKDSKTKGKQKSKASSNLRAGSNAENRLSLKLFAYFGGPIICDIMLTGFNRDRKVLSSEDIGSFFDDQFALQMKRRSAQAAGLFEINKYNVGEIFALNTRLIEIQKSSKNDSDRKSEMEKNINSFLQELTPIWSTGRQAAAHYFDEVIGEYDSSAVEVSADEAIQAGLGERISEMESLKGRDIFAERQRGQKDHESVK